MKSWADIIPVDIGLDAMPVTCEGNVIATEACRPGLRFYSEHGKPDNRYNFITADSPLYAPGDKLCCLDHNCTDACPTECIKHGKLGDIMNRDPCSVIFNDSPLWIYNKYIDSRFSPMLDEIWDARNRDCAARIRISQEVRDLCRETDTLRYYESGLHIALKRCVNPLAFVKYMRRLDYSGKLLFIEGIHFIKGNGRHIMLVSVEVD